MHTLPLFEDVLSKIEAYVNMLGIQDYFRGVPKKSEFENGYDINYNETVIGVRSSKTKDCLDNVIPVTLYSVYGYEEVSSYDRMEPPDVQEFTIIEDCLLLRDAIFNVFVYIKRKKFEDDSITYDYEKRKHLAVPIEGV